MCGLFGHLVACKEDLEFSRESLHVLSHRGPDQFGEWVDDRVYLGHRRLSILDLTENGKQPMCSDDKVILTANGEIYNFKELRAELEKECTFTSESDSEVLLHGYQVWGIKKLLDKIDGMYSFVIYDREKSKLYLARDRVGIKPLYYSTVNNRIAWSSELKSLEVFYGKEDLDVDNTSLYDFLTYRYIPAPKTLYKNIFKLEPSHYLEIDVTDNTIKKEQYWRLEVSEHSVSIESASARLKELIRESVEEQMVSDVPVGVFLSGGMDSSVVAAEASDMVDKVSTYSIGFDVKSHNETEYARLVAASFRTNHNERILDESATADMYEKMRDWYDEPFSDTSAYSTYLVSKFAKEEVTVVLTGDGGDELFGGYKWYRAFSRMRPIHVRLPKVIKSFILKFKVSHKRSLFSRFVNRLRYSVLNDYELHTKLMSGLLKEEKIYYAKKLNIPGDYDDYWYYRKHYRTDLPLLTRLQYLDFHTYLPDGILTKVDRVSMAVSLEARVPLLSKAIIEYVFSIPENVRYSGDELKGLMKYAYKNILPDEIISRSKKGFDIPTGKWNTLFNKDLFSTQEQILNDLFVEYL